MRYAREVLRPCQLTDCPVRASPSSSAIARKVAGRHCQPRSLTRVLAQHVVRAGCPVCLERGDLAEPRTWASSEEDGAISRAVLPGKVTPSLLWWQQELQPRREQRPPDSAGSQNVCTHPDGSGAWREGQDGLYQLRPVSCEELAVDTRPWARRSVHRTLCTNEVGIANLS